VAAAHITTPTLRKDRQKGHQARASALMGGPWKLDRSVRIRRTPFFDSNTSEEHFISQAINATLVPSNRL
jgi:hypothetical protein